MHEKWTFGGTAHAPRHTYCPHQPDWPQYQHARKCKQEVQRSSSENIMRALTFNQIAFIHQLTVPATKRNSHDLESKFFERQNFTPYKAVADGRVLID